MKRTFLFTLLLVLPLLAKADLLTDITTKQFNAKTLPVALADSLLRPQVVLEPGDEYLPQNRYTLHYENDQRMFRHSFWADYYLMDERKNERITISDTLIRDAQFSPNYQYIVYGKGQLIYIYKVLYRTEVPILEDTYSSKNDIFYGLSDWLYEEEFGRTSLSWFSPDSKQVAFVRLDETQVSTFTWQTFRDQPYPGQQSLRYPKAGTSNAKASVCVYDIATKGIRTISLPAMDEAYIPRLTWRSESELIIERISRDQNQMEVFLADPKSTKAAPLYTEKSDTYFIDYELFDQWQWLSDGRFVALSERDGWRQLFLYSAQGKQLKVLTPQGIDVTRVYGVDEKNGVVYYQAAPDATQRQLYAVTLGGKRTQLTSQAGVHDAIFSEDMHKAIVSFNNSSTILHYTLMTVSGTTWKIAAQQPEQLLSLNKQNDAIQARVEAAHLPYKQFTRIPTERGDTLDAWIIQPNNMQAGKQYPVVIMQYSGPASQRVINQWRFRFGHYLASQGYVVVNADPRGTDCRGRAWRNATYLHIGLKEAQDHLSVAKYMQTLPYVDKNRIAMIGWSYGGFQTIRTMMEQPNNLIRCGVAIAPVTDWRLYDSGYTERYMRRPQVNEDGYQGADLCTMADQLKGNLLLVHATGDDNVHYQNTLLFIDALNRAGKQYDTQLYIDDNHSLLDPSNNEHLHRKILLWLEKNL